MTSFPRQQIAPVQTMVPARRSLSARVLSLVLAALLLIDLLFLAAGLQRERRFWLREQLAGARTVMHVLQTIAPAQTEAARLDLRRVSGAARIRLIDASGTRDILTADAPLGPLRVIRIDNEAWLRGLARAVETLAEREGYQVEIIGNIRPGIRIAVVVGNQGMTLLLRHFVMRFLLFALTNLVAVGGLLFVALRAILVLPLRRIERNIIAFRADPEHGVPLDADRVTMLDGDEITSMGRELSVLQAELRAALWRNARLAAVGTAVAKMSHDLRGILSSVLLVSDRLTMSNHGPTRHAGEVIVRAVHRATALAQHTLDFVREVPAPPERRPARPAELVDEAAAVLPPDPARPCVLRNHVDRQAELRLDREGLLRVLTNLMRNAVQAGARQITVTAEGEGQGMVLTVTDDGPGLPEAVQARLFRPFAPSVGGGSGLGLAIARDLMLAHGGDLRLVATGPGGTSFALYFMQPRTEET